MPILDLSIEDGIAQITWCNGENRHNPPFLAAMNDALDTIEANPSARALVIASSDPKYWSLGIDLNWLMGAVVDPQRRPDVVRFLYDLNALFKRVLSFPMPVITAMTGHVFGNGAIFSCACDFRFMLANRGFFCFPEVDVNIPFLPGMYAIVKKAVPPYKLEELALTGRRIDGREAAQHHIVTQALDTPEAVLQAAREFAGTFNKGRAIFREQKIRNHRTVFEAIDRDDPPLIDALNLVV